MSKESFLTDRRTYLAILYEIKVKRPWAETLPANSRTFNRISPMFTLDRLLFQNFYEIFYHSQRFEPFYVTRYSLPLPPEDLA